mmetsp:Transcript_4188/g.13497  ORF Transcript_4188/g.13497 Transcript_4188/m.13497 type:complete len:525 (-) Transcript_4188:1443-3017(-)
MSAGGSATAAPSAFPEKVKEFLTQFNDAFKAKNTGAIRTAYGSDHSRIVERYFASERLPTVDAVREQVGKLDPTFAILYQELYFRHLFTNLTPTADHWRQSWTAYQALFDHFVSGPANNVDLPHEWLYDVLVEFVYQFQMHKRHWFNLTKRTDEEIEQLKVHQQEGTWSAAQVVAVLKRITSASGVLSGERPTSRRPFQTSLQKLGYFALAALSRVCLLLGNFREALTALRPLDLNTNKAVYNRVATCHTSLYYYKSVALLMSGHTAFAIRTLSSILLLLSRSKNPSRSLQSSALQRKGEQMLALLAIAASMFPFQIEPHVHKLLRERHGDDMQRIAKGDESALATVEELFTRACPKFVCPVIPDWSQRVNWAQEAMRTHTRLFLRSVRKQLKLPALRLYLKLYRAVSIEKLAVLFPPADLVDAGDAEAKAIVERGGDEAKAWATERVRTLLLCLKHKTAQGSRDADAEDDEGVPASSLRYVLDKDVVAIDTPQSVRRHGDFFMRYIGRFQSIVTDLQSAPETS